MSSSKSTQRKRGVLCATDDVSACSTKQSSVTRPINSCVMALIIRGMAVHILGDGVRHAVEQPLNLWRSVSQTLTSANSAALAKGQRLFVSSAFVCVEFSFAFASVAPVICDRVTTLLSSVGAIVPALLVLTAKQVS